MVNRQSVRAARNRVRIFPSKNVLNFTSPDRHAIVFHDLKNALKSLQGQKRSKIRLQRVSETAGYPDARNFG